MPRRQSRTKEDWMALDPSSSEEETAPPLVRATQDDGASTSKAGKVPCAGEEEEEEELDELTLGEAVRRKKIRKPVVVEVSSPSEEGSDSEESESEEESNSEESESEEESDSVEESESESVEKETETPEERRTEPPEERRTEPLAEKRTETFDTEPSISTDRNMEYLREVFYDPEGVRLRIPRKGEQLHGRCSPGEVALLHDSFRGGLRIPVFGLFTEVLTYYGIMPSQLTPNSWRNMVGFCMYFGALGRRVTLDLFRHFFLLCAAQKESKSGWYTLSFRAGVTAVVKGRPTSIKN